MLVRPRGLAEGKVEVKKRAEEEGKTRPAERWISWHGDIRHSEVGTTGCKGSRRRSLWLPDGPKELSWHKISDFHHRKPRQCNNPVCWQGLWSRLRHGSAQNHVNSRAWEPIDDRAQRDAALSPFEWMLSVRYLRARRKEEFICVIAGFSFLGIMLALQLRSS